VLRDHVRRSRCRCPSSGGSAERASREISGPVARPEPEKPLGLSDDVTGPPRRSIARAPLWRAVAISCRGRARPLPRNSLKRVERGTGAPFTKTRSVDEGHVHYRPAAAARLVAPPTRARPLDSPGRRFQFSLESNRTCVTRRPRARPLGRTTVVRLSTARDPAVPLPGSRRRGPPGEVVAARYRSPSSRPPPP